MCNVNMISNASY